jgi:hypothetical protein
MSGGPVKGGLEGSDAVRWITPIAFACTVMLPPFSETCPTATPSPDAKACRHPSHSVETYRRTFVVTRGSGWRGGGYGQARWCNDLVSILPGEQSGADLAVISHGERSESTCPPFNCPQYNYTCSVQVQAEPLYKDQDHGRLLSCDRGPTRTISEK